MSSIISLNLLLSLASPKVENFEEQNPAGFAVAFERRPPRYKVTQKTTGGGGDGVAESHEVPVETRGASQRQSFVLYTRLRGHKRTVCSEAAHEERRDG